MPKPLGLALFMRGFADEVAAPVTPGLARAVTVPLAAIGQRRRLATRYRRYHRPGGAIGRPIPAAPASAADSRASPPLLTPADPKFTRATRTI